MRAFAREEHACVQERNMRACAKEEHAFAHEKNMSARKRRACVRAREEQACAQEKNISARTHLPFLVHAHAQARRPSPRRARTLVARTCEIWVFPREGNGCETSSKTPRRRRENRLLQRTAAAADAPKCSNAAATAIGIFGQQQQKIIM